jgi:tRNA pseudouridine38-40 synthase
MVRNFRLIIEYDGGAYHGWQRQSSDSSIQSEIEKALCLVTGQKIAVIGSGRTDAGVHAIAQSACFRCDTPLTPDIFHKALNALLPSDIVIKACESAEIGFHARYDVKSKRYRYCILNRSVASAIGRQYSWHIKKPLDLAAMQHAGSCLLGIHDFKAFQGEGTPVRSTVREIFFFGIDRRDDLIDIEVEGNGFLRFMVRNIVGTLVDVGKGKITPEEFKQILESRDRGRAGITAPPHGLFLVRVSY